MSSNEKHQRSSYLDSERQDRKEWSKFSDPPMDIVKEIIWRLEPQSISQCKSLNKYWHSTVKHLLDETNLASDHLSRLARANPVPTLIFKISDSRISAPLDEYLVPMVITTKPSSGEVIFSRRIFPLPLPLTGTVSHCNGILCLDSRPVIALCNMFLGHYSEAPTSLHHRLARDEAVIFWGFGCDSSSSEYKVVRIILSGPRRAARAEVHVVGSGGNPWREVKFGVPPRLYSPWVEKEDQVHCRGSCFWLMQSHEDEEWALVCFEVAREEFRVVPLPGDFETYGLALRLTVFNDTVRVFSYQSLQDDDERSCGYVNLCVMDIKGCDDDGVGFEYSWRASQTIELFEGFYKPLIFLKEDEILLKTERRHYVSYNIRTDKFIGIKVSWEMESSLCYSGPFVKSLVRFDKKL